MDGVGRRAAEIRDKRAAATREAGQRRQEEAQLAREATAAQRRRQERIGRIMLMGDNQRRWLVTPPDRQALREVREMEWYSEAGTAVDRLIDTFRQWATENDIPTNVTVSRPPFTHHQRSGQPKPDELTSGWMIYSTTDTWQEDVTPAWDRFQQFETRSSTQHFFIPLETQSQASYYDDKTINNLRMTAFAPDDEGIYRGSPNPQSAALPTQPNNAAILALMRNLEQGMAEWVADYPKAPWPDAQ